MKLPGWPMIYQTCSAARRAARISQRGGGLFWRLESTVNKLDPNFYQS